MRRYSIEIEAGDGFPDQFEVDLKDASAVHAYVIELASARLQSQSREEQPMLVRATVRDERGEIIALLRSKADWPL